MAVQGWEVAVVAALGAGFYYLRSRVRGAASPEKLRGQVDEVRQGGLWTMAAGRLLVIRHDTHGTRAVRMQFRSPGTTGAIELMPNEARHLATLLRAAAAHAQAIDSAAGRKSGSKS